MRNVLLVVLGMLLGVALAAGLLAGGALWMHGMRPEADFAEFQNTGGMMAGEDHRGMMSGMGRGGMMGGMMHGAYGQAEAVPDDGRTVEQTVKIIAQNMQFSPARVAVKPGQTVRFVIENRDSFAHNFVGPQAGISERVVPGGATASLVWTAPAQAGVYRATCTYHSGMTVLIEVR